VRNVVLTTSPDVQNVSNVTLLKVMVEVVVAAAVGTGLGLPVEDLGLLETGMKAVIVGMVGDVMIVVGVVDMRGEMVSGIVPPVVLTISQDVLSVSSVVNLKGDQEAAVVDVVMIEVETEMGTVGVVMRSVTEIGSVRAVEVTTSPVEQIVTSVVNLNRSIN